MANMNIKVSCERNEMGTLNFYVSHNNDNIYLFSTRYYSKPIEKEYQNGKLLKDIFEKTPQVRQQKLRERIIRMVKYVVSENNFEVTTKNSNYSYHTERASKVYDDDYEIA